MPYTLHYFNGRGRAEIMRMMFHMAGVKYMDKRYEFSDWDRCRNDFPCSYLPCMQFDNGDMMPETMSICRYLAREYNFYPNNAMDMFRCDYIADCFYEIMHDYMRYYHWKNGNFRYNMNDWGFGGDSTCGNYDNYMYWRYMSTFNRIMPFMERTLCMRNSGNQWFMGDQIPEFDRKCLKIDRKRPSLDKRGEEKIEDYMHRNIMMWCDMMFYCCMEMMYNSYPNMFSSYPKMMGLYNRFYNYPRMAGYFKNRCNSMW